MKPQLSEWVKKRDAEWELKVLRWSNVIILVIVTAMAVSLRYQQLHILETCAKLLMEF